MLSLPDAFPILAVAARYLPREAQCDFLVDNRQIDRALEATIHKVAQVRIKITLQLVGRRRTVNQDSTSCSVTAEQSAFGTLEHLDCGNIVGRNQIPELRQRHLIDVNQYSRRAFTAGGAQLDAQRDGGVDEAWRILHQNLVRDGFKVEGACEDR